MNKCTAHQQTYASLIEAFSQIPDNRSDQGKRYSLAYILSIVFLGFIKGKTSLEACSDFGRARFKWFTHWFDTHHGVPDATTIARALSVTSIQEIIKVVNQFTQHMEGVVVETGLSLDGKTVRAISDLKDGCKHFLSLFSHHTCRILDQEGVTLKENEIPATPRLLERHTLIGSMVTADALLTQTNITKAIKQSGADYLFIVKNNQPGLRDILEQSFKDPLSRQVVDIFQEYRKTRWIKTVISLTKDVDIQQLQDEGWAELSIVGKLERSGSRRHKGQPSKVDETIYFISSRKELTPQQAKQFIRNHWHIENKLHWQKDETFKEDRSRARKGNTPGILSYFRSLAVSFIRQEYESVTRAIEEFTERPQNYLRLLTRLQLV